jgi:7,8-dihydropterin-6-yl-methyl-4-(beta-D-ribofuranosyl)aminobenzene 5'-phosphate synthase
MAVELLKLIVMVDNIATEPGLIAEHGFAVWIETENHRIVFDTGQGPALPVNAKCLAIDLQRADNLVLSHGHFDHTGGIPYFFKDNPTAHVYCHPGVVQPRYSIRNGLSRAIHMPSAAMAALNKFSSNQLHWLSEPYNLSNDIGLTGPIQRKNNIENTDGPFFLDLQGLRRDIIKDDLALWLNTSHGLVVVVGCSHSGLINTLEQVQKLSGRSTIRAVIGGFHLLEANTTRINWTINALKEMMPDLIVPCHCTGSNAINAFIEAFGNRILRGYAGMQLTL